MEDRATRMSPFRNCRTELEHVFVSLGSARFFSKSVLRSFAKSFLSSYEPHFQLKPIKFCLDGLFSSWMAAED